MDSMIHLLFETKLAVSLENMLVFSLATKMVVRWGTLLGTVLETQLVVS